MINYDELTIDELNTMAQLVRQALKRRGKETVKAMQVGDTVSWKSGRTRGRYANKTLTGVIRRVNKVRVKVDTGSGIWNVPGSMLTRVA
jgi:uncharacterized protein YkvS